jgi:SNF2 family DNA or RNA helicase
MAHNVLTPELVEEISANAAEDRWLVLDQHKSYPGYWKVQCVSPDYLLVFSDLIGPHRVISPAELPDLLELASRSGYEVAFGEDPLGILSSYEHLNDPPEVTINSHFENTVNGLLPYQVQGYNALKDVEGAAALWTTGSGKTVLATALIMYHFMKGHSDACFFLVKANNKINTQRWLKQLGDLDSIVIEGTKPQREKRYLEFYDALDDGRHPIAITNYEKFRDDFCWFEKSKKDIWLPRLHEWCEPIFDSNLFLIWDEAPTKLKSRDSKLYKGVCRSLYETNAPAVDWTKRRSPGLRQLVLTATPIEIDPEDWFNVERLINGGRTYGTVTAFRDRYAAAYDYFNENKVILWKDLDDIALRASGIVHRVDKSHPDIAAQFPKVVQEIVEIDWEWNDYLAYKKVMKELRKELEEAEEQNITVLAAIAIGQMLCDAPEMVLNSAAVRETWEALGPDVPPEGSATALALCRALAGYKLTNSRHTKIQTLRELLTERHPTEKCLVYTIYNQALLPMMSDWLDLWGVSHVVYSGTNAQKQYAEDVFKSDPSIRVFLSSDAGSDSLNLEVASVGINYDLPWNYSRYMQRIGRNERATSNFDTVYWYDLLMTHSVEMRRQKLIGTKKGYHEGLTGRASAESRSSRMSRQDLLDILG